MLRDVCGGNSGSSCGVTLPLPPLLTFEGPGEQPAGTPALLEQIDSELPVTLNSWPAWVVHPLASLNKAAINTSHRCSRGILGARWPLLSVLQMSLGKQGEEDADTLGPRCSRCLECFVHSTYLRGPPDHLPKILTRPPSGISFILPHTVVTSGHPLWSAYSFVSCPSLLTRTQAP